MTTIPSKSLLGFPNPFMHVQEQQTSGTNGSSSVGGSKSTRVINTVIHNDIAGASLSSNRVTLPAGTYDIQAMACGGWSAYRQRLYIYNVSTASYVLSGLNAFTDFQSSDGEVIPITVGGRLTLSSTNLLEVRHYAEGSYSVGFGSDVSNGDPEVYLDMKIWQLT